MASREPFDAFLQSRGGGRGGGMSTPPRGRGTPRGRGRGRGGSIAPQDYTNVGGPVNYDIINREKYKKMDNTYTASPYSQSSPKPRTDNTNGSNSPASGSGTATPYAGHGSSTPSKGFPYQSRGGGRGGSSSRYDSPTSAGPSSPSPYAGIGQASRGRGGAALKKMFGRGGGFGSRDMVDGSERGAPIFVRGKTAFETEDDQPDVVPVANDAKDATDSESSDEEEADGKAMDTVEEILLVEQVESMNITSSVEARSPSKKNSPEEPIKTDSLLDDVVPDHQAIEQDATETATADDRYSPSIPQDTSLPEVEPNVVGTSDRPEDISKPVDSIMQVDAAVVSVEEIQVTAVVHEMALQDPTEEAIAMEESENDGPGFFLDATGAGEESSDQPILFESSTLAVLGEGGDEEEEEEEEIVFVPRGSAPSNIDDPVYYEKPSPSRYDIGASNVGQGKGMGMKPITMISLPSNGRKQDKKSKKAQKKAGRQAKREGRMRKTEGQPRLGDSDIEWGSDGPPDVDDEEEEAGDQGHRAALRDHYRALMAEKERDAGTAPQHAIPVADDETEESQAEDIDMDALKRFAKGVGGQQVMIHDTELERQMQQEDEEDDEAWEDESDSDSPKGGIGHKAVAKGKKARDPIEVSSDTADDAIDLTHGFAEDDLVSGSDDDSDSSGQNGAAVKDGWRHVDDVSQSEDSDDDSDEDINAMFGESKRGKLTWADAADDMIEEMSRVIEENADMLKGGKGNRSERKKLFKSIQNGDFGDDWSAGPAPKGKKAKKDAIPDELQAQWEKDRQKKAEFKRQRQLERLEAEFDLFPGAKRKEKERGKGKGKTNKWEPQGWAEDSEEDDMPRSSGRKGKKGLNPVVDLYDLNKQIRMYLKDEGKTTMSLPPMDKFSRRKVHELANCYSLKSQSKGQGSSRFPILIKTSRSIIQLADLKQVDRILNSAPSYEFRQPKSKQAGQQARAPGGAGRTGFGGAVRHQDGDVVGGQATAIGSDNIGHKLLSMMGWSEGGKIGLSDGGLNAPISAIVKNSKLGLGA